MNDTQILPVNTGLDGVTGLFALLVLLGLFQGGGGFMGGNGNSNAIQNDINRGFDSQNLQAQTRDILSQANMNAANITAAITNGNASLIREFGNVETALTALSGKQQECCCAILRELDGVKYAGAENTQKIIDLLNANRQADLQAQINQLQLQQALCGVVRYPQASTWNAGPYPPATTASGT
jgi:hypothetical protein